MPEPISIPMRSELLSVTTNPESRMACVPATTPYCMKASMRRASFVLIYGSRSSCRISPPKCVGKLAVSKRVTAAMPLRPDRIESHALATSLPTGETIPRPVTTTRRLLNGDSSRGFAQTPERLRGREALPPSSGFALVRIDIVDVLLNGGDLFGVLVRNFRLEFFLERHHQFNGIQRVCP